MSPEMPATWQSMVIILENLVIGFQPLANIKKGKNDILLVVLWQVIKP
jgi:hypothetical protein